MELYIKNMVCDRCISSVRNIFESQALSITQIELGKVIIREQLSKDQVHVLDISLRKNGFEILQNSNRKTIEKIKKLLVEKVREMNFNEDFKLSEFLSSNLTKEYSSLSKLFSQMENVTLEQYFILLKIEKVKEVLLYDEYSLTQIADLLGYKTVQHLSAQFKKITGFSPTHFLKTKNLRRKPLDKI